MIDTLAALLTGSAITATLVYAYRKPLALRVLASLDLLQIRDAMRTATGNHTLKSHDAEKLIGELKVTTGANDFTARLAATRAKIANTVQEIEDGARPPDRRPVQAVTMPGRWLCISDPAEVIPLDDMREHDEGSTCWCGPTDDDGVMVHHSLDGREAYESGVRQLN